MKTELVKRLEGKDNLKEDTSIWDDTVGGSVVLKERNHWLSLPTELTAAIFLICHALDSIALDMHAGVNPSKSRLPIEFTLSSVCRHWRGLALDLPALWKRYKCIPTGNVDCLPAKLRFYEERSGGQLDDIYLNFLGGSSEDDLYKFLRDLLQQHSQSLRRFVLIGEGGLDMSSILSEVLEEASVPNLEYYAVISDMVLNLAVDEIEIDSLIIDQFVKGAPSLKYLYCNGVMAGWGFPPIENLTTLRIEGGEESQCTITLDVLDSLLSLPMLENLSLFIPDLVQDWLPHGSNPPITMPRLRNLRLFNKDAEFEELLPRLRAPALEYVTLKHFSTNALYVLLEFCLTTFPSVHDLILIDSKIFDSFRCSIYAIIFPSVQTLTVCGDHGSADLFVNWPSLQRATVDNLFQPGVIKHPEVASNLTRTLRVPLELYPAWQKANEQDPFKFVKPMRDGEPLLPRHWPQNDLGSQGFLPLALDHFYNV